MVADFSKELGELRNDMQNMTISDKHIHLGRYIQYIYDQREAIMDRMQYRIRNNIPPYDLDEQWWNTTVNQVRAMNIILDELNYPSEN